MRTTLPLTGTWFAGYSRSASLELSRLAKYWTAGMSACLISLNGLLMPDMGAGCLGPPNAIANPATHKTTDNERTAERKRELSCTVGV